MEQIKDIAIRMQNKNRIWILVILSTLDSLRGGLVEFCGLNKGNSEIRIHICICNFDYVITKNIFLFSMHS